MNALNLIWITSSLAAIEASAVPALRVVFTLAVIGFAAVGGFIYRRRHQFFDRDPQVENDYSAPQYERVEVILFVWGALMIVVFCICVAAWRA